MTFKVLVVDDESNIRLTVARALEALEADVHTAVNGEDALRLLAEEGPFHVVFLDLRMPGMDGLDVLRAIHRGWPQTRVIIMTAFGSVESAVEAMKLGAVDFLRKPCLPDDIRRLAADVLAREDLKETSVGNAAELVELTKRLIADHRLADAIRICRRAASITPVHPEVYNLQGVLSELQGDPVDAQRYYRAALDLFPTYEPAWENLRRLVQREPGPVVIGAKSPTDGPGLPRGEDE